MKNTILRVLIAVIALGILGYGVYAWKFQAQSVDPETVLPEDTFFAFAVDLTDDGQRRILKNLFKKFPKFEFSDEAEESFFDDVAPLEKEIRKSLMKVLGGEWKLVVGLQHKEVEEVATPALPSGFVEAENGVGDGYGGFKVSGATNLAAATGTLDDDFDLVVFMSLKSDKIRKVVDMLDSAYASKGPEAYEKGKIDDVDFWYNKDGDYKIYRFGDTIFSASDKDSDADMIARVKSGQGFNKNVKFSVKKQASAYPNLGFVYFDAEKGKDYVSDIAKESGFYRMGNLVNDAFLTAVAVDSGVRFFGESGLSEKEYSLNLIEKVPGEGMIWYSEQADFSEVITGVFAGFATGYVPVSGLDDPKAQLPGVYKSYEDVLQDLEETFDGVKASDLDKVFKSPFAVGFSYPGGFLPALGLYIQLNEENVKAADKLVTALGNYANEVVADFDEFAVKQGVPEVKGVMTQGVTAVQGGAARKVFLDWKKMPQDLMSSLSMLKGVNMDEVKLEFYYGVTGDNVLFVVFYPDFDKVYGTESLLQNPLFKMAQKDITGGGFMIDFVTLSPLADMVAKYFAVAKPLLALTQGSGDEAKKKMEDLEKNVKIIEDFLRAVEYFVDTNVYKDGVYGYDGFVRFK